MPEFELNSYDPVKINVEEVIVSEQDIDDQIRMIAESYATEQPDILSGGTKRVAPEVTDEWVAQNIPDDAINTVEELRVKLHQASQQYRADELETIRMEQVLAEITERLIGDIPAKTVDAAVDDMVNDLKMQLGFQGMTFESYLAQIKTNEKYLRKDLAEQATENLRRGFALDAVFRHEGLKLEEEDIQEALSVMAPGDEEEARKKFEDAGRMSILEEAAQRMKAGKWVVENANVTVEKRDI